MTDSEDENYVTFGVALDPLEEENITRKKAMTIEDQYAYDAQGRRRFHGAFTGGFSAGYFNTVGTRDGWRPQQFKSSRSSKAENVKQRPEDFMDEEDTSQFGIAPVGIRATNDYSDHGQRGMKRERVNCDNDGPIPGTPVLKELLKPVKETVGITLLKKMGWKVGQGVGSRVTKKEKAKLKRRNEKIRNEQFGRKTVESNSDDSEDDIGDITFAPDDYEPFRCNPKDNYFGIGYSGLDRRTILSGHVNLFDVPAFSVQDKNKKLSIHGQAFGVGAFEADDEDIYAREDMSRYDFALGPERKPKSRWSDESSSKAVAYNCLAGFVPAKNKLERNHVFAPPDLPKDFIPVHAVRKSRFYPPIENVARSLENGKRTDLTATDRARILEDTQCRSSVVTSVAANIVTRTLNLNGRQQIQEKQKLECQQAKAASSWMDKLNARNFVKGGIVGLSEDSTGSLKKLEEFKDTASTIDKPQTSTGDVTENSVTKNTSVKPFISDPDKQRRFEQYLGFLKSGEKHKLDSVQPLSMTEWDREHERSEFEQTARLFEQPTDSANRFVSASDSGTDISTTVNGPEDEMKQAVKMKMFGKLTRERMEWKPASIVCKRFNIPEPKVGCAQPEMQKKSKAKFSIFEALDWSSSTKFLKATDSARNEATDPMIRIKEEDVSCNLVSESESVNVCFHDQPAAPVSEKMKNFEASYEKVFGKEVQEIPKPIDMKSSSEKVVENTDLNIEHELAGKHQLNDEDSDVSRITSKSKSDEKKDLFKAIFLSSSEDSDSEPEETVDSEAVKSVLIGKVPSSMNTDRNTSPPRGIFAKVDLENLLTNRKKTEQVDSTNEEKDTNLTVPEQILEPTESRDDNKTVPEISIIQDMYGPALPARLIKTENAPTTQASSSETYKPVFKSVVVSKTTTDSKISGKWVERGKVKKSKKEKKKHKHKEHKGSKHKRKSKKEKRASRSGS